MKKNRKIIVQDNEINIVTNNQDDFISLTDMLKAKDGDFLFRIGLETGILLSFLVYGKL